MDFRSITFGELQKALGEDDNRVVGWKLIDRLTLLEDNDQSQQRAVGTINEELFDENENELGTRPVNNGVGGEDVNGNSERKLRRISSSVGQKERRRSSATHFSYAFYYITLGFYFNPERVN